MNCPRCGKPLAPGAAFCSSCGQPMPTSTAPVGAAAIQGAFDAQRKKNTALLIVIGILGLVAAIVTGLALSGVLGFGAKAPDTHALQARGRTPGGMLAAKGNTPPPVLPQKAEKIEMPQDVEDWLNHLKRCEELKRELTAQQSSQMTGMMATFMAGVSSVDMVKDLTNPDSDISKGPHADEFGEMTRTMTVRWTDLSDQFRKFPPPTECQPLAAAFDGGLNGLAKNIDYLRQLVVGIDVTQENAQEDIRGRQTDAQHLLRTHDTEIGSNFRQAEDLLEQICAKYNRKPWFDIDSKGSVGGLLGAGG